jgi:AraC-like DNA-binding protein
MSSREVWIYAVEELLTAFYAAASFLSNHGFQYMEIHLSYPEPAHGARYRELFSCPVFFGTGVDLFHAEASTSDRPTFTGHPQMALICQQQCQLLQAKLRGSDELVGAIREIIVSSMGQLPHLPEVAAKLAMSPRTLRRRLQERDTTYQHILDEVRIELAKEYVATTRMSVDQIAGRIGFTEAATFRRAFKKWTGQNIKEYRIRNQAKSPVGLKDLAPRHEHS